MAEWNPSVAVQWMLETARELGSDFIDMPYEHVDLENPAASDVVSSDGGIGEPIRASAGALYYAEDQGIGIGSEAEFAKYLYEQVGWGKDDCDAAVAEVKKRMG